jgi:iduronate 2-sulfatase
LDGDTARVAIAALREWGARPERPFFMGVGFVNPHVPFVAPRRYWDLYDPGSIPLPKNAYPPRGAPSFAATTGADFYWYATSPKEHKVTPAFGRAALHGYLAAISYVDAQVGLLLDELDRQGLRDNTIVALFGDNGYYMGEHGWWGGKHNNYEGATRCPLIVSAPGLPTAGRRTRALVEFVDLYPTLAGLAGLTTPTNLEGTDCTPLLRDPERPWKGAAFSQYPRGNIMGTAMRTERYRYVEWRAKSGRITARELYDHAADPGENENVADRADAALLTDLAARLAAGWRGALPPHAGSEGPQGPAASTRTTQLTGKDARHE